MYRRADKNRADSLFLDCYRNAARNSHQADLDVLAGIPRVDPVVQYAARQIDLVNEDAVEYLYLCVHRMLCLPGASSLSGQAVRNAR